MRMTALYNYRTATWPLSDSIKSSSQPERKIILKLLFWKVWLLDVDVVRYHNCASGTVAPACNAHGGSPAPGRK